MKYTQEQAQSLLNSLNAMLISLDTIVATLDASGQLHQEVRVEALESKTIEALHVKKCEAAGMNATALRFSYEALVTAYDCWKHNIRWAVAQELIEDDEIIAMMEKHWTDPHSPIDQLMAAIAAEEDHGLDAEVIETLDVENAESQAIPIPDRYTVN